MRSPRAPDEAPSFGDNASAVPPSRSGRFLVPEHAEHRSARSGHQRRQRARCAEAISSMGPLAGLWEEKFQCSWTSGCTRPLNPPLQRPLCQVIVRMHIGAQLVVPGVGLGRGNAALGHADRKPAPGAGRHGVSTSPMPCTRAVPPRMEKARPLPLSGRSRTIPERSYPHRTMR